MTTTRAFDALNRLQSIVSVPSGSGAPPLPVSSAYDYNTANQRTRMTLADYSYWTYTYDRLGQVVSGKRYWQDGTPVAGQQFEYGFDDIGNRKTTATGGDATGGSLRFATYGANLLNQYTNRTVPAYADILGVANPTAAVTVNGNTAYRKGDYFWHPLAVANSSAAQYPLVTTLSQYGAKATNTGNVYLPQTPETSTHDADGNLTQDGHWDYTWDGENRLIAMQTRTAVTNSGVPNQRLEFSYDPQSRRISKTVSNRVSGVWNLVSAHRFLYDGWNLLAILNPQLSIVQSFAWGLDLSGSLQGAGGVGGLLWVSEISNGQISNSHAACYDGNGNVTALVNFSDASVTARYEYGPFGEPLRQTGVMAEANAFRFSTKFTDDETGMLYYGYRSYNPALGRWLSRDPLGERGGGNLHVFVGNQPLSGVDLLGLCCTCRVATITYNPGAKEFTLGFYKTADGKNKFGNKIHVKWTVDGNPTKCKYAQHEKGWIIGREWNESRNDWDESPTYGTEKDEPVLQEYDDNLGSYTPFVGLYEMELNVEITFKCTSSDGKVIPTTVTLKGQARGRINADGTTTTKVIK